eukprot:GILJ01004758.1.p1 GENE.GILJ01004758.1~~GILJ01004758.1.p1  ORF type:complete len:422 (+),score=28.42 GILJ01004758.1:36-1268(+)
MSSWPHMRVVLVTLVVCSTLLTVGIYNKLSYSSKWPHSYVCSFPNSFAEWTERKLSLPSQFEPPPPKPQICHERMYGPIEGDRIRTWHDAPCPPAKCLDLTAMFGQVDVFPPLQGSPKCPVQIPPTRESFDMYEDPLLIVHFNSHRYERMDMMQRYKELFKNVVFTGPPAGPTIPDFIPCSFFSTAMCEIAVLEQCPGFVGYLVVFFDVVFNHWNFRNFTAHKPWMASDRRFPGPPRLIEEQMEVQHWWLFPNPDYGLPHLLPAFDEMPSYYRRRYEAYVGEGKATATFADMFYIPGRHQAEFLCLATHFFAEDRFVHLELAIPTILRILSACEPAHEFEGVPWANLVHDVGKFGGFHEDLHYYHPVPLYTPLGQLLFTRSIEHNRTYVPPRPSHNFVEVYHNDTGAPLA